MNIIIGNMDARLKEFIKQQNFTSQTLVINKMCNVKYITEPINLYIPYGIVNKYGLVNNTMVHLEELLISANVIKIFYGDEANKEYMEKINRMFFVKIEKINSK